MHKFSLFLLISILFVTTFWVNNSEVQGQNQDNHILQLQGFIWNRVKLNALIVTTENESWWNPNFVNITVRSIGQWNDALDVFSQNYSDFSYLSSLKIQWEVSNESLPGYDIYINWNRTPLRNTTDEVGLSRITVDYRSTIINCTINLAAQTSHGDAFNEGDMQNIAVHEFGHSLGLGHSNYTGDLMYPSYTMGSPAKAISTLDTYGVATLFAWQVNSTRLYPVNRWLKEYTVALPKDVPYHGLPISPENDRPQTFVNNPIIQTLTFIIAVLMHPEILAIVIVFVTIILLAAFIPKRRKRVVSKVDS